MILEAIQNIPSPLIVLAVVTILLIFGTVGLWVVGLKSDDEDLFKIGLRIRFWWVLTVVFTLAYLFGQTILFVAMVFISYLALKEFLSITPTRRADRRVLFLAYLSMKKNKK